jgi:beta-N-acetylhexosaminidase
MARVAGRREGGAMTLGPLMVDVAGKELTAEDRRVLAHPLVGAVILFTRNYDNPEQLESLVGEIRALRRPPLLVTVDHEGGRVQRFRNGFTELPPQRAIGHAYDLDPEAGRRLAWQFGWLLAPITAIPRRWAASPSPACRA